MKILEFFYTEGEVAKTLGVNRLTVLRWIKEGKFDIQRVGREVLIAKLEVDMLQSSRQRIKRRVKKALK